MDSAIIFILIIIFLLIHVFANKRRIRLINEINKKQEKEICRYKILAEVLMRNFENKQEQLDYVLNEALQLTESQYGYIYFYDEEKQEFTLNSWTQGVMEDCKVIEKSSKYQLDKTGIWGEAVRQRKPIIVNNFHKSNPLKKGCPHGHVALNRFMTIPVFIDDKIVAVVGLGNKKSDYDDYDVYQLKLLMNGVWNAVERREVQENIKYLSFHDSLTNLYNRRFFEEELKRLDTERNLPISIIMGDVNGLKITNDVFGHANGDLLLKKVAEVLKRACRADDIIARSGGDEFMILLPKTANDEAEKLINRIKTELSKEKVKFIKCNMSMGANTKWNKNECIDDIKEKAEEKMYYVKATEKKELQKETVDFMIKTLHENLEIERNHSINVSQLCEIMGRELNLSEKDIQNLKTAGYFHDIGKVALESKYLDEDYTISCQENKDMKRHAVLGYRILNSIDSSNELAETVLFHHEHWDGSGYPKGLKGEDIPLNSRIISLVEYYDRNSHLSKDETLKLIRSNAGIKFDPQLIEVLEKLIK
ncbi:MAG: diguanylate cyclase [Sedimentibacter sp.]